MKRPLVLVLLAALPTGCGDSGSDLSGALAAGDSATAIDGVWPIAAEEPSIRGVVTVSENGSIQVETNPTEESGSPKAMVRLMPDAQVVYRSGDPARPEDLTVGHNVSVWFEGPVAESYPVQASASMVVIEPAGVPVAP